MYRAYRHMGRCTGGIHMYRGMYRRCTDVSGHTDIQGCTDVLVVQMCRAYRHMGGVLVVYRCMGDVQGCTDVWGCIDVWGEYRCIGHRDIWGCTGGIQMYGGCPGGVWGVQTYSG